MSGKQKVNISDILLNASSNSRLSCGKTCKIIEEYSLSSDEVIETLNSMKIKINACQMGLFGYEGGKNIPPVDTVSDILKNKISLNLENGKLACGAAWKIASELNIKKMDVASACEMLKIRINQCQLKAF